MSLHQPTDRRGVAQHVDIGFTQQKAGWSFAWCSSPCLCGGLHRCEHFFFFIHCLSQRRDAADPAWLSVPFLLIIETCTAPTVCNLRSCVAWRSDCSAHAACLFTVAAHVRWIQILNVNHPEYDLCRARVRPVRRACATGTRRVHISCLCT